MNVVVAIAAGADTKSTANALAAILARLSGAGLRRFAIRRRARQDGTRRGEVTGATVATASQERRFSVIATVEALDHALQSQQMFTARASS
jgi:NAD(P)H-hydrate repair Nnr-like enzyme with NAD(P)H-hydrate dehydratase domain